MRPVPNPLLDARPGVGRIGYRVEWRVLSRTLDEVGEVHPEVGLNVTNDTSAQVKRALRGFTLTANDARELQFGVNRIRPTVVLEDGTEWPVGAFMLGGRRRRVGSAHVLVEATLMDQGYMLTLPTTQAFSVPAGGSIYDALVRLTRDAGVLRYVIEPTNQRVGAEPIGWLMNTPRTRIYESLCRMAGFASPYFDNDGWLQIGAPPPLQDGEGHRYDVRGDDVRIVADTLALDDNLIGAPNVYVVACTSPGHDEIVARAYVDPRAPHSRENIGFEVPDIETIQGLASTEQAQRIADARAAADPLQLETVEFSSTPDPRHDTYDSLELNQTMYRELYWSLQLGESNVAMTHRGTRRAFEEAA